MKKSYPTVTDQFCGAGGSSQGALKAGAEVKLALNHWSRAIETHQANFPHTTHDCADMSAVNPRRYQATDILITSPECTNHSLAKGIKKVYTGDLFKQEIDENAERSRATMWDVPRFAEVHKYRIIIVENVVDARKWIMWDAWLIAMKALGYNHECLYLNSMHFHPCPQSRDRMYVIFIHSSLKKPDIEFTPDAFCSKCNKNIKAIQTWKNKYKTSGKYRTQYNYSCSTCYSIVEPYYYAAFNAIDWSDLGTRIGDKKKELSPNTKRRILFGLDKYQNDFIINDQHSTGIGFRTKSIVSDIPTLSTTPHLKLVRVPFVIKQEHGSATNTRRSSLEFQTQTTRQSMSLVIPGSYIIEMNSTGECKPSVNSFSTVTAGGINHGIVSPESFKSFISYYYGQSQMSGIEKPIGTVTTKDRSFIISYQKTKIEDCFYRMIKPHEVQKAMAFHDDYIVTGNSKEKVKQLGNAVTPPVMEWILSRVMKVL